MKLKLKLREVEDHSFQVFRTHGSETYIFLRRDNNTYTCYNHSGYKDHEKHNTNIYTQESIDRLFKSGTWRKIDKDYSFTPPK